MLTTITFDMHPILPNQAGPQGQKILGKTVGQLTLSKGTFDVTSPGFEGVTHQQAEFFWVFSQNGSVVDKGSAGQQGSDHFLYAPSGNTYLKGFNYHNKVEIGDLYEQIDANTNAVLGACIVANINEVGVRLLQKTVFARARFNTLTGAYM